MQNTVRIGETVGDRLKMARKAAGLTQKELADAVYAKQGAISDLENGRNNSSTKLVQMAIVLGVNPRWLSTGTGEISGGDTNFWRKDLSINGIPVYRLPDMQEHINGNGPPAFDYEPCRPGFDKDGYFWIHLEDNSMSPEFNMNDRVLFSARSVPQPANCVLALITDTDDSVFRRWRPMGHDNETGEEYSILEASNPYHPSIDSRYTPFELSAVAVTHLRHLIVN